MIRSSLRMSALLAATNIAWLGLFIVAIALFPFAAQSASAQQSRPRPSPKPSPQPTPLLRQGTITGRVITDDGQPLTTAQVTISPFAGTVLSRPIVTVDTQGRFQASNLVPGGYSASASAPGYVLTSISPGSGEYGRHQPGDSVTITMTKSSAMTGKVTNERGEPMINARVDVITVRREEGYFGAGGLAITDDRGIYRVFGLAPGAYVVAVNWYQQQFSAPSPYSRLAPTFYPSATRETATEITVRRGEEVSGIDIRFRQERGHTISGRVTGADGPTPGSSASWEVTLTHVPRFGAWENTYRERNTSIRDFTLYGLPDGEYELKAEYARGSDDYQASLPRRITINGADVTGIELPLLPLAYVSGRVVVEKLPTAKRSAACAAEPSQSPQETRVVARLDEKEPAADRPRINTYPVGDGRANEQGEFTKYKLPLGHYRFLSLPPNQFWYVRSIILPTTGRSVRDVGREGLTLSLSEHVSGLTVKMAEGAARLSGQVIPDKDGTPLPRRLYAYLVPVERQRADDLLRYVEAFVEAGGKFAFGDLAPGKYWLLVRTYREGALPLRPAAWNSDERAKLRREAQAANVVIDLQPCQRVSDYTLHYAPPVSR